MRLIPSKWVKANTVTDCPCVSECTVSGWTLNWLRSHLTQSRVIGSSVLRKTKALGILFLCVFLNELGSQFCQLMEPLEGGAEVLHHLIQLHRQGARQFPTPEE